MSRLRLTTVAMSVVTGPVTTPNRAPARARCATLALQISFLLGRQAMFGQEPPIQRRSTTAARRPDCAMCQANSLPLLPLPRIRMSNCSGRDMFVLLRLGPPRVSGDELIGNVVQVIAYYLRLRTDPKKVVAGTFDQRSSPARRNSAEGVPGMAGNKKELRGL